MSSKRIGIVGGCLGSTRAVRLSELYYRTLLRRFEIRGYGRLSITLGRYDDPSELVAEARRLLEGRGVDVLVLQMRPHPLVRSAWLLWWKSLSGQRSGLALHPALWDRGRTTYDTAHFSYAATHPRRRGEDEPLWPLRTAPAAWRRWFMKGNINSVLGWLVGLQRWALRQHVDIVRTLRDECVAVGVRLIVMGPASIPILPAADLFCRSASRDLGARLAVEGVDYVEVWGDRDGEGRDLLQPDAQHVNALGHARLADLLEPVLARALAGAARVSPAPVSSRIQSSGSRAMRR